MDRFAGVDWEPGRGGLPLPADDSSPSSEIVAEHPAGAHWIVVGQVDRMRLAR